MSDYINKVIEKNNIVSKLKQEKPHKNGLTKKEKLLIVTTAISQYTDKNKIDKKDSEWVIAGRQEQMENV